MLIRWLIFLHVLSALTFYLGHGAAAVMAFRLRREEDLIRIRAILDLSTASLGIYIGAFIAMGVTGLILPFLIGLWDQVWIWTSIVLMMFVAGWMSWFTERTYKPLRRLVGLPYMVGNKQFPAEEPAEPEEVRAHIAAIPLRGMVVVGYFIPAAVLWLMIFKPG